MIMEGCSRFRMQQLQTSNTQSKFSCSSWTTKMFVKLFLFVSVICRTCGVDVDVASSARESTEMDNSLVLFISFDGFRYDYLTRTNTPNFDKLIESGSKAEYLYDAFVTKTFPNHYTMVTGLYEESHGIIGNYFYDPELDDEFHVGTNSTSNPEWWNAAEPIWLTNQRQGGHSGAINYVGSDVKIRGEYPTYHLPKYDPDMTYHERVDRIVTLFSNKSINLGLLYFNEPDHSGHTLGPESPLMIPVLKRCDETVGYLIKQLEKHGLYDKVNVVISSDHGMAEVTEDKIVFLEDIINVSCCRILSNNPLAMIWPNKEKDTESIYQSLKDAHPNMAVYRRDNIPSEYHYHDNIRIPPILAVVEENWQLYNIRYPERNHLKGEHGYNNSLTSMHPFFIAHGPAFKEDYHMEPFRNVDIYPLLCHLLGIEPSPNNGSLEEVKVMLKEGGGIVTSTATPGQTTITASTPVKTSPPAHHHKLPTIIPITIKQNLSMDALIGLGIACFIALLATFLLVAMCIKQRSYRQPAYEYMPIEDTSIEGQAALQGPHASYFYPNTKI